MKKLLILSFLLFSLNNLSAQKYIKSYINDANKVGLLWWDNVNSGLYEKSYNKLSPELKSRAGVEDWINQLSLLMHEFGKFESRVVKNTDFDSELAGFEDGFYVTIEYEVKYSKTQNHTEYLLLKQSDEFEWQILDFNYSFQDLDKID